jgi:hypothetical protein
VSNHDGRFDSVSAQHREHARRGATRREHRLINGLWQPSPMQDRGSIARPYQRAADQTIHGTAGLH